MVADIVDVVRALTSDPENRVPHLAFQADALSDMPILSMNEVETAFYLRMKASDKPGVLADVTKVLGDHHISIEAIIQKEPLDDATDVQVIMLTHEILERNMNAAIAKIEALDAVTADVVRIRVETLGR